MRNQLPTSAAFGLVGALLCAPAAAQWNIFSPQQSPPARTEAPMTFDTQRGEIVLFGGRGFTDTWIYDGVTWTQRQPANSPPVGLGGELVWDFARNRAVYYGGQTGSSANGAASDDTWEWDGTDWTLMSPIGRPGGLAWYGAAYDFVRSRVVVYGGRRNVWQSVGSTETWEYDGTTWTQVVTANNPGPRDHPALSFGIAQGRIVLFGGVDPQGNTVYSDTWTYDGTDWTQVPATGPQPGPREHPRMIDDTLRRVVLLFGGRDPVSGTIHNDTWTFDGTRWTQHLSGTSPPRWQFSMAINFWTGRTVLFGGRVANNALQQETWEYGSSQLPYGNGCMGSQGVVGLRGTAPPRLGATATAEVTNLLPGATIALMTTGLSNATWAFGSLPAILTPYGLTGCRIYQSADVFLVIPAAGGIGTWTFNTPNNPVLVGSRFYQQGLSIDPGHNPAGLVTSNALTSVIGY